VESAILIIAKISHPDVELLECKITIFILGNPKKIEVEVFWVVFKTFD
jgi:hypothetical protein